MSRINDTGESRFFCARKKCSSCGGALVLGIDISGLCPECLRLNREIKDYGKGSAKGDLQAIRESRFWHTEDGFVVDGCYRRICN